MIIFLQIWIGRKPKAKILNKMKSVFNSIGAENRYTLIAEKNYLSDCEGIKFIPLKNYLNSMFFNESIKKAYESIPQNKKNYWALSDIIRLHYLSRNRNTLYCDTDLTFNYVPILENKVYFTTIRNLFDYFLIYNAENTSLFDQILTAVINKYNYMVEKNKVNGVSRYWCFEIFNNPTISKKLTAFNTNLYNHSFEWNKTSKR